MVTQKMICAKIDFSLLEELDLECHVSGQKRNAVINKAIKMYIEIQDYRRRVSTARTTKKNACEIYVVEDDTKEEIYKKYIQNGK